MFTIIHNPRCSKSRQTLQLLEQHGQPITVVEYLKTPLTQQQIEQLITQLGITDVRDMMRVKEDEYKTLGLATATQTELLNAMVEHPKLIERPIVVKGDKAVIGRPPENVTSLF